MVSEKQFVVHGDNGLRGVLFAPSRFLDDAPVRRIRLENGTEIVVTASALEPQKDGSFYLRSVPTEKPVAEPVSQASVQPPAHQAAAAQAASAGAELSSVVAASTTKVDYAKPQAAPSVPIIGKSATEPAAVALPSVSNYPDLPQAPVGEPLFREDCDVKRVNIRRLIDKPAETRQEGDTLIIPMMEEVWIVEKKLLLREEIHITRKKDHVSNPNVRLLRKEEIEQAQAMEPDGASDAGLQHDARLDPPRPQGSL